LSVQASLPPGVSYNLSPQSGNPTFISTFSVDVPKGAPLGTYPVTITGSGAGISRSTSFNVVIEKPPFDLSVTSLDIRTFICKNKSFDSNLSYLNEYLSKNPNYMFAPSTTYAEKFYNEVAKNTCPESQRNRPVEFSATGECVSIFRDRPCPPSKLRIYIRPAYGFWPEQEREIKEFTTPYNSSYPKSIKEPYIFNKPYDYLVTACFVDQNNRTIKDANPLNTCKEQTLRIFDYMCMLGFCAQNQRDIENPSSVFSFEPLMYKIIKVFGDTDSPCRFYRNEICRARFGF
jgi:hypothetical protein